MTQPSHLELAQQIARMTAIIEPLPTRLDKMQEKFDADIAELKKEISSLKEERSRFVGIGVGIGFTLTTLVGFIALMWEKLAGIK